MSAAAPAKPEAASEAEGEAAGETLIDVRDLQKTFTTGLFIRKRVEAVRGVTFSVARGEIFGFLGPNGAGKTTTIKMLTGLIHPSGGKAFLFGEQVPSTKARKRIGFLPENPYIYPYLTPREFIEMAARLSGLRGRAVRARTEAVLASTGIAYAADRQAHKLSKGMLQRAGLAAALVADPEMLILDEPMSGLDPVGRKEVRDLIFHERDQGRTIFFSTHILSDVEAMCDRVAILRQGRVVILGAIRKLLRGDVLHTDVLLGGVSEALRARIVEAGYVVHERPDLLAVEALGAARTAGLVRMAVEGEAQVIELSQRRETLEDLFLRNAL